MKITILVTILAFSNSILAKEKLYTEEELNKKVDEIVTRKLNLVKKKTLTQLAKDLLDKEEALQLKEKGLKQQEEQIKISERSLLKKINDLEKSKEKIIGCIDENKRNELMRVKQLVSVISNMKPLKAAELLSVQQSDISVKLLEKIDPQKASKIFNLMDKEVSARLQKQYLNMQQ